MKSKLRWRSKKDNQVAFQCPACNEEHVVSTIGWRYNNNPQLPTFKPSILWQRGTPDQKDYYIRCHTWLNDGVLFYHEDCTHNMVGQTIEIPYYNDDDIILGEKIELVV